MISPWLRFSVLALAVIAYAGAVGLAWTCAQHTCATAFIHNLTLSSSIAIVFSTAAVFVQLARLRWLTSRTPRERRLLLFSGTPAVGVIICWAVALAVVDSSAPNNALSPARAAGPTAHCEAARSGSGG